MSRAVLIFLGAIVACFVISQTTAARTSWFTRPRDPKPRPSSNPHRFEDQSQDIARQRRLFDSLGGGEVPLYKRDGGEYLYPVDSLGYPENLEDDRQSTEEILKLLQQRPAAHQRRYLSSDWTRREAFDKRHFDSLGGGEVPLYKRGLI